MVAGVGERVGRVVRRFAVALRCVAAEIGPAVVAGFFRRGIGGVVGSTLGVAGAMLAGWTARGDRADGQPEERANPPSPHRPPATATIPTTAGGADARRDTGAGWRTGGEGVEVCERRRWAQHDHRGNGMASAVPEEPAAAGRKGLRNGR